MHRVKRIDSGINPCGYVYWTISVITSLHRLALVFTIMVSMVIRCNVICIIIGDKTEEQ